jgi:hypothetical protein
MSVIGAIVGEFVASRAAWALDHRGRRHAGDAFDLRLTDPHLGAGLVLYGIVVAVEHVVAPWAYRSDAAN